MGTSAWSKDNPFADQTESSSEFSADNPFADHATAETTPPTPTAPTDEESYVHKMLEFVRGAGEGAKNVVAGTIGFAKDVIMAPFTPLTKEELADPGVRGRLQARGIDPSKITPGEKSPAAVAKQLGYDATVGMVKGTYESGKTALSTDTPARERGQAAVEAVAGASSIIGMAKGMIPDRAKVLPVESAKVVDPVTAEPIEPAKVAPSEAAERQHQVDAMAAQEVAKQVADKSARSKLLNSANTWNTLKGAQRKSLFEGLADADYDKRWSDLGPDAKKIVGDNLVADTNLDTSQPADGSVPAAQGEGAGGTAPEAVVETAGSTDTKSVEAPGARAAAAMGLTPDQLYEKLHPSKGLPEGVSAPAQREAAGRLADEGISAADQAVVEELTKIDADREIADRNDPTGEAIPPTKEPISTSYVEDLSSRTPNPAPDTPAPGAEGTLQLAKDAASLWNKLNINQQSELIDFGGHAGKKWEKLPKRAQQQFIERATERGILGEIESAAPKESVRSLDELDAAIDSLDEQFDAGTLDQAVYEQSLKAIADEKKALKASTAPPSAVPTGKFKMPDTHNKELTKFDADALKNTKRSIAAQLQDPAIKGTERGKALMSELDRILDYESAKRKKSEGGFLKTGLRRKALQEPDMKSLPHYEQTLAKKIVHEQESVNPYSVMDHFRRAYARVFRGTAGIESATRVSGKSLPTHLDPGKLAAMSSRFLTQAEEFLRGNGPFVPDDMGGFTPTGALSLNRIANMVKNDIHRLDWLWGAARELEERATRNRSIGLDPVASQLMFVNTPKEYHMAMNEGVKYNRSLADYAQWGGLIDAATREKFTSMFYGPIKRIFGHDVEGSPGEKINLAGGKDGSMTNPNPIKKYQGSDRPFVGFFENTVDITPRIIRAANQNKVGVLLTNLARENPKAYEGILEPAKASLRNKIKGEVESMAKDAKAQMEEYGVELSLADAEHFVGTLGDGALNIKDNVLGVWVDGKLEHWAVHPELAYALKSMSPHELGVFTRLAGVPAQVQRFFIVNDPTFIMTMSMIDTFQSFVNSKYGFIPVVDSFRGWWHAVTQSPEYADYKRGGGGQSSLTSRQYAKSATSLHDVVGPESTTPAALAIQQLKTAHPVEAWRTIVEPVAEAARIGEFLRARGRGASIIEAVYAAKEITGNYSLRGGDMVALNHMALFLNPALQVLDKTIRTVKDNPTRWFAKASTVGVAAWALWMANKDDQEIQDLRQTEGGSRYFFFRTPGNKIIKVRKPYLEGAIFAGGMEAALDKMYGENPEAVSLWSTAVLNEMKVNLLPAIGVIPMQIWANKDLMSGAPIVPDKVSELEPMFQQRAQTGAAERIIGRATNTSPAMISFLARSQFGYLGANGISGINAAIEWKQSGELPVAEELPFVNKVMARYPSSNVKPIRDFYQTAERVDRVANTIDYMAEHEPELLESYIESHQEDLALSEVFKDARAELADFRKAMEDIQLAKPSDISPSDKRKVTDEFLRQMIELARISNAVAHDVK
jgi:hypothetical protein